MTEMQGDLRAVVIFLIVVMGIFMADVIYIGIRMFIKYRRQASEKKRLEELYAKAEAQKNELESIVSEGSVKDEAVHEAILKRLSVLDGILASKLIGSEQSYRSSEKELSELLDDKDGFMESTRLCFSRSHPAFIEHLESCGLTQWECGYCCLYAMGLRGKDVGNFVNLPGHYNIDSTLRRKLGLGSRDTNLSIYLKRLADSGAVRPGHGPEHGQDSVKTDSVKAER